MSRRPRRSGAGALHVVLLAGGSGTRFWPLSRARRPKQLLPLVGGRSLLRQTWDRSRLLAPAARIWVVAPRTLATAIRRELRGLRPDRLVIEPSPRDTAPAIALACARIAHVDPRATVAVLPTDHVVQDPAAFRRAIGSAERAAAGGALVCLGVKPDRPATGFGYLKVASPPKKDVAIPVATFVEKPDAARARRFVRSGRYLWNGGMFVWRVTAFLEELDRCAPEIHAAAAGTAAGRRGAWTRAPRISVDYAVMERATRVVVVPLEAGWDDVGSWDAAARLARPSAVRRGARVVLGSPGSEVFGADRFVALVDVPGVVVVQTADALLVVSRAASEKMKAVVEAVRAAGRSDLL